MTTSLAIIETMRSQGHSEADILAVVEAAARAAEPIRSKRQDRNHRYYENHKEDLKAKASEKRLNKTTEQDAKGAPFPPYDINSTPLIPRQNIQNAREKFSEFKKAYPKRSGANPWTPAEKKFLLLVKSGIDPNEIIVGAKTYAASMVGEDPQFVAQAVTWLNQRRWLDEHGSKQAPLELVSSRVFVIRGSPQWTAWTAYLGKPKPTTQRGTDEGWYFESEWPPDATVTNSRPVENGAESNAQTRNAPEREGPRLQASGSR